MENVEICYEDSKTNIFIHKNVEDYVSKRIRKTKSFYECNLLHFLIKEFPIQRNMIDIGANIGNHTLFFLQYFDCDKVYSFEPLNKNINIFKENTKNYIENNKCILYEFALSDKKDSKILYNSEKNNYGGVSLHKEDKSFIIEDSIEVNTLDSYNIENVTFIKIDVENHENEVLIGAKNTILKYKPVICLENSYHFFSKIFKNPEPHKNIFEDYGYVKLYSNICNSGMDLWIPYIL